MANSAFRSSVLAALLDELSIPYSGVQVADINADPVQASISYRPEATAEQIALGDSILAAFDWQRRRALPRNTVVTALQTLTTAQQNAILRHMACEFLRTNPTVAAKINAALGVSLPVDEVDPT